MTIGQIKKIATSEIVRNLTKRLVRHMLSKMIIVHIEERKRTAETLPMTDIPMNSKERKAYTDLTKRMENDLSEARKRIQEKAVNSIMYHLETVADSMSVDISNEIYHGWN